MHGSESSPRILAVDDDPVILRLLSNFLVPAGYEVLEYTRPANARKRLEAGGIALLITDLNMPGGTGLDLARELRRGGADLPIIILSGSINDDTRKAADDLGGVLCITKPLDQQQFLRVVQKLAGPKDV